MLLRRYPEHYENIWLFIVVFVTKQNWTELKMEMEMEMGIEIEIEIEIKLNK